MTIRTLTFTATCPVCGGEFVDDVCDAPTLRIRTCEATCSSCDRDWLIEVTIRPLGARNRSAAA